MRQDSIVVDEKCAWTQHDGEKKTSRVMLIKVNLILTKGGLGVIFGVQLGGLALHQILQ